MKIVALSARILLGVVFTVFGANGFLHFLPQPPMPPGLASQFVTAVAESHYILVAFAVQLVGGVLLLVNRYVPLALTLLGPVIVNILCFHLFLQHAGLPLASVVALLWLLLFYWHRQAFAGIFAQRTP
jgi:hypothetical protein